ncbi:MAG: copper amine oxidase N-terminal domain-containing protein [Syntrophothermus sp.]|uniref:copper amine oxidase N-terminal domain-containing protein n=1 Tax=Syntrophothermus sp. TaxID=2736299 RepID=UPI00258064CD|nr:copper amine oxidase N-terminal domain-containing protein [Syntrophothermus sp.]NSW82743.1 copper amine oxidase N-terminal domain-containing protein [Syntrophothermus sp.]
MKKAITLLTLLALILTAVPALAVNEQVDVYENQQLIKSVVFAIGLDEYFINGQLPGIKMDARAFIENDRTYVPVRYLGRALGLKDEDITWDNDKKKATLKRGSTVLEMVIGEKRISTNGETKEIDVAPLLKQNPAWRTYLPARYVAEGLGYEVDWDAETRTVICWPKGDPRPDVAAVKEYVKQQTAQPTFENEPVKFDYAGWPVYEDCIKYGELAFKYITIDRTNGKIILDLPTAPKGTEWWLDIKWMTDPNNIPQYHNLFRDFHPDKPVTKGGHYEITGIPFDKLDFGIIKVGLVKENGPDMGPEGAKALELVTGQYLDLDM